MSVLLPSKAVMMVIHQQQIQRFGGTPGIRDKDAVEEILRWPAQLLAAEGGTALNAFQIAALIYSITASRHPFQGGNKRLGLSLLMLTLQKNGWLLDISNAEATQMVRNLSIGHMTEDDLVTYCRTHSIPFPQ